MSNPSTPTKRPPGHFRTASVDQSSRSITDSTLQKTQSVILTKSTSSTPNATPLDKSGSKLNAPQLTISTGSSLSRTSSQLETTPTKSKTAEFPQEMSTTPSKLSREERKKALQAFYQLDTQPTTTQQKQLEKKTVNDLDMDTPNFNSEKYVAKLLSKKTLSELINENSQLTDQTKNLDTQMQKLVYQNYNKFITATDTIKKMKSQVGSMEGEMEALSKSMDEILDTSNTINRNLATKREKIERLSGVNKMLKKLQFILELPDRLNGCLKLSSYSVAVQYYTLAEKILEKYRHLPSFQAIEKESNEIMSKMKKMLREQVSIDGLPRAKNIENHKLLFLLGEDIEELLNKFLSLREADLVGRLKEFERKKDSIANNLSDLNKKFLTKFFEHHKLFKSVFLVPEAARFDSTPLFGKFTDKMFSQYFTIVNSLFGSTPLVFKENHEKALEDIRTVMVNFSNEVALVDEQISHTQVSKMISACLYQIVSRFLLENFVVMNQHSKDALKSFIAFKGVKKDFEQDSIKFANRFFDEYYEISKQFALFLELNDQNMVARNADSIKEFLTLTTNSIDLIFDMCDSSACKNSQVAIVEKDVRYETTPTGALLLSKLAMEMRQSIVPKINGVIVKMDSNANLKNWSSKFDSLATKFLIFYIERQAFILSGMIQVGLENQNWIEQDPPKGVKHMVQVLSQEVDSIVNEVIKFYPDEDDDKSESASFTSEVGTSFAYKKNFGTLEENTITKDVLKLFNKNLTKLAVTNPEFNKNSIMSEIIKLTLKTYDECVRMMTFSKCGYQQVQVDTHYLQMMWRDLIEDENFVRSLLSDIFNIASERCWDPVPLQPNIVSQLCSKK